MRVFFEGGVIRDGGIRGADYRTRIRATVIDAAGACSVSRAAEAVRVILVHWDAPGAVGSLYECLEGTSGELQALYNVEWNESSLRAAFAEEARSEFSGSGARAPDFGGTDLEIELLLVKRVLDALGPGSVLVAMPCSARSGPHWAWMGFDAVEEAWQTKPGYTCLYRSYSPPEASTEERRRRALHI